MTAKPILKWPGGKSRLAPQIDEVLGPSRGKRYFEPFCGTCAVFLHRLQTGRIGDEIAEISDVNPNVVRLIHTVRTWPLDVTEMLLDLPSSPGWESVYYEYRTRFNANVTRMLQMIADNGGYLPYTSGRGVKVHDPIEHAALMLWLNHACFNGLWRENRKGLLNSPIGRYETLSMSFADGLVAFGRAFGNAHIRQRGFEVALEEAGAGDTVYCDPPYAPLSKTASFTSYSGAFGETEQRKLASCAAAAVQRGARVVLSNSDVPWIRELYEGLGFEILGIETKRSISCKGEGRGAKVGELIISGG